MMFFFDSPDAGVFSRQERGTFLRGSQSLFAAKTKSISKFGVAFDVDGTLTREVRRDELKQILENVNFALTDRKKIDVAQILTEHGECDILPSWPAISWLLPASDRRLMQLHAAQYTGLIGKEGEEARRLAVEWGKTDVGFLAKARISRLEVMSVLAQIPAREGWGEVDLLLRQADIPACAVTYGVMENLKRAPFHALIPYGCEFVYDELGRIVDVEMHVTTFTKNEAVERFRNETRCERVIAVGDSLHDRHMFAAADFSIYVDHHAFNDGGLRNAAADLQTLWDLGVDAIIRDVSLTPLAELLKLFIENR
jgi:hypothetical protein